MAAVVARTATLRDDSQQAKLLHLRNAATIRPDFVAWETSRRRSLSADALSYATTLDSLLLRDGGERLRSRLRLPDDGQADAYSGSHLEQ